jgi:hypothetical protein
LKHVEVQTVQKVMLLNQARIYLRNLAKSTMSWNKSFERKETETALFDPRTTISTLLI